MLQQYERASKGGMASSQRTEISSQSRTSARKMAGFILSSRMCRPEEGRMSYVKPGRNSSMIVGSDRLGTKISPGNEGAMVYASSPRATSSRSMIGSTRATSGIGNSTSLAKSDPSWLWLQLDLPSALSSSSSLPYSLSEGVRHSSTARTTCCRLGSQRRSHRSWMLHVKSPSFSQPFRKRVEELRGLPAWLFGDCRHEKPRCQVLGSQAQCRIGNRDSV